MANGYVCQTNSYATYVTGIPYTMNVSANDDWNAWSESGPIEWGNSDRGTSVRIGYAYGSSFSTSSSDITKSLYVPVDTKVVATSNGEACGCNFWGKYETTYTFYVSDNEVGSQTSEAPSSSGLSGKQNPVVFEMKKSVTMTATNPTIKHYNSNSTSKACSYVKSCSILYE